jgi:hypothetical protein
MSPPSHLQHAESCFADILLLGTLCGVRKRNSDSFVRVPTEPDFFILFLNFIVNAKSKNLAVNGSVTYERLQLNFALHIGVVTNWPLFIFSQLDINFVVPRVFGQTHSLISFSLADF